MASLALPAMPPTPARTRIAPTPSGYLHEGNAVNILLVRWLADDLGASVALRIDDLDPDRCRPAYVQDVFEVLTWLEVAWDSGPVDADDFHAHHSLQGRQQAYWTEAMRLVGSGHAYACTCSRREGSGSCVADCRLQGHALQSGHSALRLAIPPGTVIEVDGTAIDLRADMGDPIIWRRDGLAAYHLASVIEDRDHGITHVVRGEDLRSSSALHVYLGGLIGIDGSVDYRHHPLVEDIDGRKLSKSQLRTGPMPRTEQMRDRVHAAASRLAPHIGLSR